MIIIRLSGGLGNQLFQYAAGRRLAHMRKTQLAFDLRTFQRNSSRRYALGPFNIQERFATAGEIAELAAVPGGLLKRTACRLLGRQRALPPTHIREKERFHFDPRIMDLPDGIYLDGSWQNERYFSDAAAIIRREFSLRIAPAGENQEMLERISACNSVGIHVRRGDYASNPRTNRFHGTCAVDYYSRCLEMLVETNPDLQVFIFSDEPHWAASNLRFDRQVTIVNHNDVEHDYEDLRLMAACRHQIIANSTFSWWAAWLNQNPDKQVFAPEQWLLSEELDTSELIPPQWRRI